MPRFLARLHTRNLGDKVSSPALYLPFGGGALPVLLDDILDEPVLPGDEVVIGGGGWLRHEVLAKAAERSPKMVVWGVGENVFDQNDYARRVNFPRASLLGVRDWPVPQDLGVPARWVPCASCLHPAFSQPVPPARHQYVVYDHYERRLVHWRTLMPAASNADFDRVEDAVAFLASGSIVVTNSYHGLYWATLLRRRVLAVPYASRFRHFRYPPTLLEPGATGFQAVPDTLVYPGALEECRAANYEFFGLVREFFKHRRPA